MLLVFNTTNLSYGKMGNRKVKLVLQHCFAKLLHVLPRKNQTCFATNLVAACFLNTGLLMDKITRESHHKREFCHLLQTKFTLNEPVKRATCTDFVAKSRTTLYYLQQIFATCNNLICGKTGLNVAIL